MRHTISPIEPVPTQTGTDYVSVDSAPAIYSAPVELWRAPALLALHLLLCLALMWVVDTAPVVSSVFYGGDLVAVPMDGARGIPFRIMILSFMISFSLFSQGPLTWRLRFLADLVLSYLALCAILDATVLVYDDLLDVGVSAGMMGIISGLTGFAVFSFKLLERGNMPSRIKVYVDQSHNMKAALRLVFVLAVACFVSYSLSSMDRVEALRSVSLLGGIGPGIAFFLPTTFLFLYFLGRVDMVSKDLPDFAPPLTVIIPAHNEAYIIATTIAAIDVAAEHYAGSLSILVMDNNSTDDTAALAITALAVCQHAKGRVIAVPTPGKAHALNAALEAADTEFVVRIDADTQVTPHAIHYAMRRMADPTVGVVGGLPVPPGGGKFDNARRLELVVKHGFYSVGLSSVNAVVGVPGMFALYRRKHPLMLGGFVQGMNGEDTDMSLRIGELGYRLVIDPRIRFVSEVPTTFHHMREQRMRWFRSVYHVSSRCRDLIYSPTFTIRGKILLPFMLVNSAMRAMLVPLFLFGLLIMLPIGISDRTVPWRAVLAVIIGAPAMVAVAAALLNRSFGAVLHLPEYLVFRMLRSYYTLESLLSITLRNHGTHIYTPSERVRPKGKARRDA